jgi:hypothetical protein
MTYYFKYLGYGPSIVLIYAFVVPIKSKLFESERVEEKLAFGSSE